MKILALELSSARGSIACIEADVVRFQSSFANDRKHSGLFFENLQRCLRDAGHPDRIVVGLGPGSYAGTRIAVAAAIGLRASTGAELVGLCSLCAIETEATDYCVIGDARRQTFHFSHVRRGRCIEGPQLCTEEELTERLASISVPIFATELLPAFDRARAAYPSALVLAQDAPQSGQLVHEPLEPIYLSEPHITQPKIFA